MAVNPRNLKTYRVKPDNPPTGDARDQDLFAHGIAAPAVWASWSRHTAIRIRLSHEGGRGPCRTPAIDGSQRVDLATDRYKVTLEKLEG